MDAADCMRGQENYEKFTGNTGYRKKVMYHYDYRTLDGVLFSTIKPTLNECRKVRDQWLIARINIGLPI
jgi:hypothetical protein